MKNIITLVLFVFSSAVSAYDCYLTGILGPCWKNYVVTIKVLDNDTDKTLATITIPKGKLWAREKITCVPRQAFLYQASFTPKIWKDNPKNVYGAISIYHTPEKFQDNTTGFIVPICFPRDFSEVPLPPDAKSLCDCKTVIPSIPPLPNEIKKQ